MSSHIRTFAPYSTIRFEFFNNKFFAPSCFILNFNFNFILNFNFNFILNFAIGDGSG